MPPGSMQPIVNVLIGRSTLRTGRVRAWQVISKSTHRSAVSSSTRSTSQGGRPVPAHRAAYERAAKLWLLSGLVPPVNDVPIPGTDDQIDSDPPAG